jgi:L-lactate dehydrogenase complex protein LldE
VAVDAGAGEPVVLYPTCLVDTLRPSAGEAAFDLLRRAGYAPVLARGATCCGQPAYNSGFVADARRVAVRTVRALARLTGPIVVPAGSCTAMLTRHVPDLLRETRWAGIADAVAARVVELSTFLAGRLSAADGPAAGSGGAVTYHDSCHMLRELRERDAPRRLLAEAGYEVCEMPGRERCCGFGGTFSVKLPAVSLAMADEKLDEAVRTGTSTVVGSDVSCLSHLDGRARHRGLALELRHVAEVL